METISTTCVIAGGGPAGMMLGFLLARAGIDVTVLEKHKDFLRDFRGDTVHPSTLQIMKELGLLEEFLALPHAKVRQATADFGDRHMVLGDFSRVDTACKFIALMPQWDFLNFIAEKAKALPNFHLLMETEARDLIAQKNGKDGERIAGLLAVRASDIVARIGGDEFVVFASGCDDVALLKRRLLDVVAQYARAESLPFRLSVSIGSSEFEPAEGVSIEAMMAQADAELLSIKRVRNIRTA